MTVPNYTEAVAEAKKYIEANRWKDGFDLTIPSNYQDYCTRYTERLLTYDPIFGYTGNILQGEIGEFDEGKALKFYEDSVSSFLVHSQCETHFFSALCRGVAKQVEMDNPLHPILKDWLVRFLLGEVKPPIRGKGRAEASGLHNLVPRAVSHLVEMGLTATRGDASPATSACDAVAEALAALSLSPITYSGVKPIWNRWKKSGFYIVLDS